MKMRLSLWMLSLAVGLAATGCITPREHNLPPAERLMAPGPGVAGPGPGVLPPGIPVASPFGGGMPGQSGMLGCPPMMGGMPGMMPGMMAGRAAPTVQILFSKPEGMQVRWDVTAQGAFDSVPLVVPGRYNFPQAAIYRVKQTNIAGREGVELYPTLEIGPTTPRTEAYLAHNAIPVQFTDEDFDQVLSGNFVTKVIYLPDPEFQEMALAGVETLVSTRLDPGVDPITEADRRGAILAVIRLGNKDVELPGSSSDANPAIPMAGRGRGVVPVSYQTGVGYPPGMMAGQGGPMMGQGGPMMGQGGPMALSMGPSPIGPSGLIPPHVAGITAPEWGMPYSGTPIGLPGPPHIPFGGPAGLKSYTINNHTRMDIPEPTRHIQVDVRQQPGFSYPQPPNHANIRESMIEPSLPFNQPQSMMHETVQ